MKSTPLISIVTAFLNAERFIEETIESVLAQTHSALELLLVDDGSSDNSTAIARRYAARYPDKLRYFEHPHHASRGASAARNLALRYAGGEYVAILDADDVWLPRALESRLQLIQSRPNVGMVYGPALLWFSWSGKPDDKQRDCLENLYLSPGTTFAPPAYCSYLLDYDAAIPSPCATLIHHGTLRSVGGFEDSFRDLFDDQVLYIKLALITKVLVSDVCDAKYRQHSESVCAIAHREGRTDVAHLAYVDWVQSYLREQRVADERVWTALNAIRHRTRWPHLYRLSQTAKRFARQLVNE